MLAIGSDHAGFALKQSVIEYLNVNNIEFEDIGCYDESDADYPVITEKLCDMIIEGKADKGVIICGTGIGVSIAANRNKEIHAALCHDVFSAKACRQHNNANVLAMGGRVVGAGLAVEILKAFLETEFEGSEKRIERVKMYS